MRERRAIASVLACGLLVAGFVVGTSSVAGAVTVGNEADLRARFADSDDIVLANDISLTDCAGGDLDRAINSAVVIEGAGFTITQTCPNERVMHQGGTGALTVQNLTITGGNAAGNGGGGIWVTGSGAVNVIGSTIRGNTAPATGGGGINAEHVFLTDSTISGNQAADFGAGINATDVTAVRSTISGNTSAGRAGGIAAATISLTNSTVSGNAANGPSSAGGFGSGGGLYAFSVDLVYSTVVSNGAGIASNVYAETGIESFASVVALPTGAGANCAGGGATTTNGYNFSDDASCAFAAGTDRQSAGDPGVGALASNGGPTETRLPGTASPLIDAIPAASCQADGAAGVGTDQRGVTRPQGSACDIGAVEVEVAVPLEPTFTG